MANPLDVILHASGSETASGVGPAVDIEATTATARHPRSGAKLLLEVTALTGVALLVYIETAPTLGGSWRQVGLPFRGAQAAGFEDACCWAGLKRYVRVRWTIQGSGSATFAVTGQAHTLYCDPKDITDTAIDKSAIEEMTEAEKAKQLLRATADAETALNSSYALPITGWGEDLRGHVAARAAFYLLSLRGFEVDSAADQLVMMNGGCATTDGVKSAAQRYFEDVATGRLKPVGIVDATPDEYEGSGVVVSGPRRYC